MEKYSHFSHEELLPITPEQRNIKKKIEYQMEFISPE